MRPFIQYGAEIARTTHRPRGCHMGRSISRRDFGKLAGGVALLALQPSWSFPAFGQSLRNDLKDLRGELNFDDTALQTAADDFGHVVHKKPVAVLRPGDAQDIAKLVQYANRQGIKVAMRGQGHSFLGQTQVERSEERRVGKGG